MEKGIHIEGLRQTEKALIDMRKSMNLTRATVKNTVKRALVDAADPLVRDAESKAPHFTGRLQKSISAGKPLAKRLRGGMKVAELEVYVGAGDLPQATKQEFGTSEHSAQPFLRPAWDGNKRIILKRISDSIWKQIKKTAERLERKAAKVAAKAKARI